MGETFPRGRIVWHELMTTNPDAAVPFYRSVVGWDVMPWEQDRSYRLWTMRGDPCAGLMELPEEARLGGAPPNWMMYVAVPDIDQTMGQATAMGGMVLHGPQQIEGAGRFVVLSDPQGAVFAVMRSPGEQGGHDGPPKPGEFSWHELATTDWRAGWRFYQALFGWEKMEAMEMGPMGVYQMFGRKGQMLGGVYNKPPDMPAPPHWLCYAMVPNADTAAASVTRLGGKVLNGPMDVPGPSGDRIAQCMDPQGAAFAVHSTPRVAKARPPAKPKAEGPKAKPAAAPKAGKPAPKKPAPKKKAPGAKKRPVKKVAPARKRPVKKAAVKKR
ncbi:MAG: VOC family protein [Gemmatimonadota bacterium]|nr:VOC family protein [Gemmatimonadota bacterium]